jgi:hypothetical protein
LVSIVSVPAGMVKCQHGLDSAFDQLRLGPGSSRSRIKSGMIRDRSSN